MPRCNVCYRQCEIPEGKTGFCGVRSCRDGKVIPDNYGRVTGIALDPIEKKPLARFMPGSRIISVGSYGCNLRCPFCQNYEISWSDEAMEYGRAVRYLSPEELVDIALDYRDEGNIGVAYTYNEPLVGYEYVRDCSKLVHEAGLKNVLVSNGMASLEVLSEISPYIDAMNIDLKGFSDSFYEKELKGNRKMVMDFISEVVKHCHVEVTCLVIPGENDSEKEMDELSAWVAGLRDAKGNLIGKEVPLHISRFFPRFHMMDRSATDVGKVYRLVEVARKNLKYVYPGNC